MWLDAAGPIDFAICAGRLNILTVADLGSWQP
jgi:hypothetical protein